MRKRNSFGLEKKFYYWIAGGVSLVIIIAIAMMMMKASPEETSTGTTAEGSELGEYGSYDSDSPAAPKPDPTTGAPVATGDDLTVIIKNSENPNTCKLSACTYVPIQVLVRAVGNTAPLYQKQNFTLEHKTRKLLDSEINYLKRSFISCNLHGVMNKCLAKYFKT
jgi:hypothetical protein